MALDKAEKFVEDIPMSELFDEIKRFLDLPDLKFKCRLCHDSNDMPYITFKSQNLVEKVGFLKHLFSEIYISTFHSSTVEKEDGSLMFWCTIAFDYIHPGGGSNGKVFYKATYKNGFWDFDTSY